MTPKKNDPKTAFKFKPFSIKQKKLLTFWTPDSPVREFDGIIADGAVRSGKTISMGLSFVLWAMESFNEETFAFCGKTVGSCRRNVIDPLKRMLNSIGYTYNDNRSDQFITIKKNEIENTFYIFGGHDERSQDLIQGITCAGILFDEVALMPKSFVTQGMARCSIDGSRMFFNCNPSYPAHWFKKEVIDHAAEKSFLYLHFDMDDNLSLTDKIKDRYKKQFTGVFYRRYILGEWCKAEGLIYPMYEEAIAPTPQTEADEYILSIDYGTQNAFAALLWGKRGDVYHAEKCYYYSGRDTGIQKTDEEYGADIDEFMKEAVQLRRERAQKTGIPQHKIRVIIDPSAASFIALMRKKDWAKVRKAENDVNDGIRETANAMHSGRIKFDPSIWQFKDEAEGYVWDEKQNDKPVKEKDHLLDATRYMVYTLKINALHRHKERNRNVWDTLEMTNKGFL